MKKNELDDLKKLLNDGQKGNVKKSYSEMIKEKKKENVICLLYVCKTQSTIKK